MMRFPFFTVRVASLTVRPFQASRQIPPHAPEEIIQLVPAHRAIHFTLAVKGGGFDVTLFPAFAYLLSALCKIPPNLFSVFNLVDAKAIKGQITWSAKPEECALTVIVPPLTRVSAPPGL